VTFTSLVELELAMPDVVLMVPLSAVAVVRVVLQPNSARLSASTAMRVRAARCVFIGDPPDVSPYFKTHTRTDQYVPVELVVPEVDVVPVVAVVDVVAVFVTGAPVPVSVAVVPVAVDWTVSVDPVVVSAGLRAHAAQRERMAMRVMMRMRINEPPRPCGAIVAPGWRAT
jgi:hypothetical protein